MIFFFFFLRALKPKVSIEISEVEGQNHRRAARRSYCKYRLIYMDMAIAVVLIHLDQTSHILCIGHKYVDFSFIYGMLWWYTCRQRIHEGIRVRLWRFQDRTIPIVVPLNCPDHVAVERWRDEGHWRRPEWCSSVCWPDGRDVESPPVLAPHCNVRVKKIMEV